MADVEQKAFQFSLKNDPPFVTQYYIQVFSQDV